jgi:hypothetical protein
MPYKLPDIIPLARSHTAPVLDTDWSPHADNVVASGGEDGKVLVWQVDGSSFDGWNAEGWVPVDFSPVLRIDASPRKVGQVLWHPAAQHVLASAVGDHTVKLWDLGAPESPRAVLAGHADTIQSIAFSPTGQLLATTSRDRKIRLFDPRAGGDAVRVGEGHAGVKGARVVWMGEHDRIATTGFSRMSDRQVGLWEIGALKNLKTITLDQSAGVVMPFWSDNNILFLGERTPPFFLSVCPHAARPVIIAGKGDGNIRYYEYENDNLYALDEHKSSDPQRGMCFVPRRAVNTSECEIARAYKVTTSQAIEPIAFIVPRKVKSSPSPPPITRGLTRTTPHPVRLVPIRHLPPRVLHRALPHSRRVLLRQTHRAQIRLARHGRSIRRRPHLHPHTDSHTLRDRAPAPARTAAVALGLARRGPTTHQSRERAPAAIPRSRPRPLLSARLGVRPNARITRRRADPALPFDVLIRSRRAFFFFSRGDVDFFRSTKSRTFLF